MKITYNWLKEYIDFKETPQELADKLTAAGFEVEELIPLVKPFSGVVTGFVGKVEKHPNADKLSVCTVSDGTESFQVICGAANVAEGQTVPFAQTGAVLPGGFKIKKAKIRGVESFGMICSKEELGLETKSEGIWALETAEKPGLDFYQLLNSNADYVYDFFITPNRPDCLSMIGIAREVAAFTGNSIKYPEKSLREDSTQNVSDHVSIHIHDEEGCPRYAARVIKNVTLSASPEWMQQRLSAVGIRPINNIVDITNYVLMETGHPLHAFDLSEIKGSEINVRSSKPEEKFTTLDEKERQLPENTVLICDSERAVAIGGIMGGLNSEVSEKTKDIRLESAYFAPVRIARSGKKLGLSSEASQRFERGADPNAVPDALNRAAYLMQQFAGGTVVSGIADVYPQPIKPYVVPFHPEKINRLLGTDYGKEFITEKLQRLQLEVSEDTVTVPTFRVDIKMGVDLAEEVGRTVNYTNLPVKEYTTIHYDMPVSPVEKKLNFFTRNMLELNLREAFTASMIKKSEAELFQNGGHITILNPISDDMTTMRPSLLPGLLKAVNYNINRNMSDVRLFESGRIFTHYRPGKLPEQPHSLAMVLSGKRWQEGWNAKPDMVDFYDIKGYLESFIAKIALDNFQFILYDQSSYLCKEEALSLEVNNQQVGVCGKIEADVCSRFGIDQPVYAFEINLDLISESIHFERQYKPVSRYPYSERDMAFILDDSIPADSILSFIRRNAGPLLQDLEVFDVFRGGNLEEGKKSAAFRMRFQALDRTLGDKEVDKIFRRLIKQVEKQFDASLRN